MGQWRANGSGLLTKKGFLPASFDLSKVPCRNVGQQPLTMAEYWPERKGLHANVWTRTMRIRSVSRRIGCVASPSLASQRYSKLELTVSGVFHLVVMFGRAL